MATKINIGYFNQVLETEHDKTLFENIAKSFDKEIDFNLISFDSIENFDDKSMEDTKMDFLLIFNDRTLLTNSLHAAKLPPIIVIELPGSHSYFAEISLSQLDEGIKLLVENNYSLEKQNLMKLQSENINEIALNDIYITSTHMNSRIRFDLIIDGDIYYDQPDSSNGILLSTPIGSTAMAMNIGGSLIHNNANVIQFQSIASRNYLMKQMIISENSNLELDILDGNFPLFLQIDSRKYEVADTNFSISNSDIQISFVKFRLIQKHSLQQKLTQKLTLEDTSDLTSSAKFILHVLQHEDRGMKINELMEITHLTNQKTMRNSLKLLMDKGLVRRQDNLEDMREHMYYFNDPLLSKFYS